MKTKWMVLPVAAMVFAFTACGSSQTANTTSAAIEVAETSAETEMAVENTVVASAADYVGSWAYEDYYLWLKVFTNNVYSLYDYKGGVTTGSCEYKDGTMVLYDEHQDVYQILTLEDGVITDSDGDTLISGEVPEYYAYVGTWEYDDAYMWIVINANGTYTMYDYDGYYRHLVNEKFEVYSDGIVFLDRDGEEFLSVSFDEDDSERLVDNKGKTLYQSEVADFVLEKAEKAE